MGYRCKRCEGCERCKCGSEDARCSCQCDEEWSCTCKCNVGSESDVIQKAGAIGLGTLAAIGGTAVTIMTGGAALAIAGGAIAGAGLSSAVKGTVDTINREKISGSEYLADVAIGGATGLVGGVGAKLTEGAARAAVTNIAREGCKRGAIKLGVRTLGGVATGLASTATGEAGQCLAGRKRWRDYGNDPEPWMNGMVTGAVGGVLSHTHSNARKLLRTERSRKAVTLVFKTSLLAAKARAKINRSIRRGRI